MLIILPRGLGMDRTIEQTLKSLETMVFNPEGLVHWTEAMEVTANNMQNDKNSKIKFRYEAREKSIEFFLKDYKSRDYLVKSIEIHFL